MNLSNDQLRDISLNTSDSIQKAVESIQSSGAIACVLVFENERFINVITDGDIRRALLGGLTLSDTIGSALEIKLASDRGLPVTVNQNESYETRKTLFERHSLRQLVLVDDQQRPVAVIDHKSMNYSPHFLKKEFSALVMAGGFGTRLRPYTNNTPKPMLEVNGRPMLEITIENLVKYGANKIYISTHYLPHVIRDYFGDGSAFGVAIEYLHESSPLGTGGALALLPKNADYENILVINGDILTKLDVGMFLAHHIRAGALMTLASTQYTIQVPFGVLTTNNSRVIGLEEKPSYQFSVNSGIYLLRRSVLSSLPSTSFFNMTDIANMLIDNGDVVECFPVFERWIDVGRPSDYELAANYF
jgi:dTDP-glucose pyrophosphorylase/CBS domain-containing protein